MNKNHGTPSGEDEPPESKHKADEKSIEDPMLTERPSNKRLGRDHRKFCN